MKPVPYDDPQILGTMVQNLSHRGDLAPRICAPLVMGTHTLTAWRSEKPTFISKRKENRMKIFVRVCSGNFRKDFMIKLYISPIKYLFTYMFK